MSPALQGDFLLLSHQGTVVVGIDLKGEAVFHPCSDTCTHACFVPDSIPEWVVGGGGGLMGNRHVSLWSLELVLEAEPRFTTGHSMASHYSFICVLFWFLVPDDIFKSSFVESVSGSWFPGMRFSTN